MEKMLRLLPTSLFCTLLLWCLQGCWCAVTVTVTDKVETMKGDSATLPCSFTVSTPSSNSIVEWYIEEGEGLRKRVAFRQASGSGGKSDDGTRLTGRVTMGEDFSLTIAPVHTEDERRFHCQVTAGAAGVGQGATELKVFFTPEKPEVQVSGQVISVTDTSTSEVGMCLSRNGHLLPRIIWYKDLTPLPEVSDSNAKMYMVNSRVKEASGLWTVTSTLYLHPQKDDRDSVFHCAVEYNMTNGAVETMNSEGFSLTLHYPTEHVTFSLLSTEPIKEGDKVELKCVTDGNPQPEFDFVFIKEGKEISLQGSAGLLTLPSVMRDNAGTYRCEALDFDAPADVALTKELTLVVHYLNPVVITPAGPALVPLGESVDLHCKTKASDKHTLLWKKGSTVLSQNGVLSLKSVSFSDAGEYSCVGGVPSVPGLHAQANVTLTVSGKPEIEVPSDADVQKEGDMLTLMCSAQGHPAPQFTWTPPGTESVEIKGNTVISTVILEATADVLKDGVTCEAANVNGVDTKQFQVSIRKDTPTDLTDSNGANRADRQQGGSSGVVIAVVVCVLLLLLLVAILYFMQKKGKLPCGKQDKKDVTSGEVNNEIVVEMKSEKANEEAGLLNKRPTTEQ
ncbi:hypothetical protein AAFF_G00126300 [Aldrovandia affinis]|uniref:Ig-like domain-containing protein n=1 Tax=Aldrovandia affinis TaxID=143900 RepID=A0AAD7WAI3_9TELE|nr:hypothetical protein AAFF_G00126300 [Aldrovandia affinis]